MDKKIIESVLIKKSLFVPIIFTKKQFGVLSKYYKGTTLSNAEKKALYTSIKKKIEAVSSIVREQKKISFFFKGSEKAIPERIEKAKELLIKYSKKYDNVFISGSFLFSQKFNDIDIFIVRKRGYKEKWDGNNHLIFLSEKKLQDPIFQSASLISISNFEIPIAVKRKKISLSDVMSMYHESVIESMKKGKKSEAIRDLIFNYHIICKNLLVDGKDLKEKIENTSLPEIDNMLKKLCEKLFSKTYLYVEVHTYIKTLKDSIKNIKPNKHLIRFRNTYEELIYGKQRSETKAA